MPNRNRSAEPNPGPAARHRASARPAPRRHRADPTEPVRRETRRDVVRIVEFSPFPRCQGDQHSQIGFTRDLSPSGMCLGSDEGAPVGSLLRITVQGLDGRPDRQTVGRVVWSNPDRDSRHWLGLELLVGDAPERRLRDAQQARG